MMTKERIEELLDSRIRPGLMMDGGNIELIDVKENRVYVRLMGACGHCPSAMMTLRYGVERILKEECPDLEELVAI